MTKNELLALVLGEGESGSGKEDEAKTGGAASLSDVEAFRRCSPKQPPMIAEGMPDYDRFCIGYTARSCERCAHYVSGRSGLFCKAWEAAYPGAVRWCRLTPLAIAEVDV